MNILFLNESSLQNELSCCSVSAIYNQKKKKEEALLLLKGELLQRADASTKSLTLEEIVKKWKEVCDS